MKSWLLHRGSGIQTKASGTVGNQSNMASNHVIIQIRKAKRFRSAFTTEQVNYLEQQFKKYRYISSEHRKEIAEALSMQERAIKIWFQNRRMKEKKDITNKESNDEINQTEKSGKGQLNNERTLQSTNEQLSYSLPPITKPAQVDSTSIDEINVTSIYFTNKTNSVQYDGNDLRNTKFLSMNANQNHNKKSIVHVPLAPTKHQEKVPKKNVIQPSYNPAQRKTEIGLSKKEKEVRNNVGMHNMKQKVPKKLVTGRPTCRGKGGKAPVDLSSNKVQYIPQVPQKHKKPQPIPSNPSKQEISGAAYYPVIPTIYAHPLISSGGMIWKPVSVMPVMSTSAFSGPSNSHEHFGHDLNTSCSCNCHGNIHPVAMQPSPINPYAQYVITAPFQKTSPSL